MTSQNFVKNVLKNPDGSIATVENVGGIIFKTGTPLLANATISTGWISYDQYASTSVIIYSDVISAVLGLKYEYSSDAGATILDTVSTSFVTLNDFRVAIFSLGKGTHIRITYQNSSTPQTKFYLSVTLSLDMVNSMGSVFTPINTANIASITKTFLQIPSDNTQTATYDFITRTGNSLNVNNTNSITGFNLEATQLLVKAKTDNLDVLLSTRLKPSDTLTKVATLDTITNALPAGVNSIGQVTANAGTNLNTSALALDTTLTGGTQKAILRSGVKGTAIASDVTSSSIDINTQALDVAIKGIVSVTGGITDSQIRASVLPVSLSSTTVTNTVAISGTITANIGTTNGLALDTTLISGNQKSILRTATKGTSVGADTTSSAIDANTQALDVSVKNSVNVLGTFFQTTQPVSLTSTTVSNTVAISATSLPLPTNASTSTLQTTGNTSLSSLDSKTPALVGGKQPVIISNSDSSIIVNGLSATGIAPALNPVSVSGVDGSGLKRHLLTDVNGKLETTLIQPLTDVQIRATSLPVIANAGTNLNTSLLATDVSVNTLLKPSSTLAAVTTVGTITNALPIGINRIGTIGINDGTNNATIKPASIAVVATDTALVVTVSPNTPVLIIRVANSSVSTTITAGGTAQTLLSANISRNGFELQNTSGSDLFFSFGSTASLTNGFKLPSNGTYSTLSNMVSTSLISIFGATTGQSFTILNY